MWRTGCWPPERYVVVSGELRVRSGRVRLVAGSVVLEVELSDVLVAIEDLRLEISCPEGARLVS